MSRALVWWRTGITNAAIWLSCSDSRTWFQDLKLLHLISERCQVQQSSGSQWESKMWWQPRVFRCARVGVIAFRPQLKESAAAAFRGVVHRFDFGNMLNTSFGSSPQTKRVCSEQGCIRPVSWLPLTVYGWSLMIFGCNLFACMSRLQHLISSCDLYLFFKD